MVVPALANAVINRAIYLVYSHRREEGFGELRQALSLAEEHGLSPIALRARFNLAAASLEADRWSRLAERARRREDPDALAGARAIYTELGASRWLSRIEGVTKIAA